VKRIIPAFVFTIVFMASAAAQALEEEQDWYTWYEQQSAQAAAEEARQYAQYYETVSLDHLEVSQDVYYTDVYDDAPIQTQEQTTPLPEEPAWIWSGEEPPAPDQVQPNAEIETGAEVPKDDAPEQ
jgi:hypothetical protein